MSTRIGPGSRESRRFYLWHEHGRRRRWPVPSAPNVFQSCAFPFANAPLDRKNHLQPLWTKVKVSPAAHTEDCFIFIDAEKASRWIEVGHVPSSKCQ